MTGVAVVAVMVVGIVAGPTIMLVLAPAVVLVGMLTVVVTTMTSATMTVGMNCGYGKAKDRQDDHPCNKGDQLYAFHKIHV
jgi:hypothetical protein